MESEKSSRGVGIEALRGWSSRRSQPRLLPHSCGPAPRLSYRPSSFLQSGHDEMIGEHLEKTIVLWLGPQKEPVAMFGADLLVIV